MTKNSGSQISWFKSTFNYLIGIHGVFFTFQNHFNILLFQFPLPYTKKNHVWFFFIMKMFHCLYTTTSLKDPRGWIILFFPFFISNNMTLDECCLKFWKVETDTLLSKYNIYKQHSWKEKRKLFWLWDIFMYTIFHLAKHRKKMWLTTENGY